MKTLKKIGKFFADLVKGTFKFVKAGLTRLVGGTVESESSGGGDLGEGPASEQESKSTIDELDQTIGDLEKKLSNTDLSDEERSELQEELKSAREQKRKAEVKQQQINDSIKPKPEEKQEVGLEDPEAGSDDEPDNDEPDEDTTPEIKVEEDPAEKAKKQINKIPGPPSGAEDYAKQENENGPDPKQQKPKPKSGPSTPEAGK